MHPTDLSELMAALLAAIARLSDADGANERGYRRAIAHLLSAYDELELIARTPLVARV